MTTIEITKQCFNSIVENEQNCFKGTTFSDLAEKTYFRSKGMNLFTIFNFISNIKQYYTIDINA